MPAAGVFKKEIDLSLYVEIGSDLKIGVVHTFQKGPLNDRTLVTNLSALEDTFGRPIDDDTHSQGFFALREYFRNANQAYVVRAESAANPAVAGLASLRGGADDTLATAADGATSVPATREFTTAGSTLQTAGVVAGDILEIADGTADDGFYGIVSVDSETQVTVDRDWPTGSLATLDFTIWTCKRFEATDGATSVPSTRTLTSASAAFIVDGVQAGDVVYINDTGDTEDNGFYVVQSVPSATTLIVNRDFPSGSLTGLTFAVYGANHPDLADGDTSTDGEFTSALAKFQDHNVKAGDLLIIEDATDTGDNGTYVITGLKTGSEDTTLEVNVGAWATGSLTGLNYRVVPGIAYFTPESEGEWADGASLKTVVSSVDTTQFDLEIYDSGGYLNEKIYNLTSATLETEMADSSSLFTADVVTGRLGPAVEYTATVNGGDNGTTGLVDSDFIGTGSAGLQLFKNIEEVEVDVLLVPGYSSQNIGDALVNMCELTRGDCMTILDPPDYPTVGSVQDVIDWHNGTGGFGRTSSINTSYAALYWPWVKIYDPYHDVDR